MEDSKEPAAAQPSAPPPQEAVASAPRSSNEEKGGGGRQEQRGRGGRREIRRTKVVIRNLPFSITEEALLEQIRRHLADDQFTYFTFFAGNREYAAHFAPQAWHLSSRVSRLSPSVLFYPCPSPSLFYHSIPLLSQDVSRFGIRVHPRVLHASLAHGCCAWRITRAAIS